jgi:hypothetical protein
MYSNSGTLDRAATEVGARDIAVIHFLHKAPYASPLVMAIPDSYRPEAALICCTCFGNYTILKQNY